MYQLLYWVFKSYIRHRKIDEMIVWCLFCPLGYYLDSSTYVEIEREPPFEMKNGQLYTLKPRYSEQVFHILFVHYIE